MEPVVLPRPIRVAGAVGVALFILASSVVDPPASGGGWTFLGVAGDKWLHAAAYAALAGALSYATLAADARGVALVVVGAAGYGFGIEIVQAFLPMRSFDLADLAANAAGALAAGLGWGLLRRRPR